MAVVQRPSTAAQTSSRDRIVPLQSFFSRGGPPPRSASLHFARAAPLAPFRSAHRHADAPPARRIRDPISDGTDARGKGMAGSARRDDRLLGRRRGRHALDDDGRAALGGDEMQLFGGDLLDALRRAQRLDLEPQVAVHVLLGRALLLHPLDLVAVAQELEVLPRREEQHQHEEEPDAHRAPELPLPRLVDLADDGVVANVLLDRVLEVHSAHANLSIARSFALRARALRATSPSDGVSGRFVRIRSPASARSSARKVCFTIRSSSEWNVITASRAFASSRRVAAARNASSPSSSRFTQIRSAWNVRVAGSIRWCPRCGTARRTIEASRPVVSTALSRRAVTMARATR